MKRKILMMSSVWNEEYISSLLQGIRRKMEEDDMELHVFNAYDVTERSDYHRKEQEIFYLPDPKDYDGMLIAINSVGNVPVIEQMISQYRACGKKILSIDQKFDGVPFAGIDNYHAFYRLVEHMITAHGCRKFNFLGGPWENEENQERYHAFCDCLRKHGLQVEQERILHCNFLYEDGWMAYHAWKEKGLHLPDALICANDNMALGYCEEAEKDGYFAPENFRIIGFDNSDEGQHFFPSITSVNRNWEQLGYESICRLLELIDGKRVPEEFYLQGEVKYNESCGCGLCGGSIRENFRYIYRERRREIYLEINQRMVRQLLCGSTNQAELQENMGKCRELLALPHVAVCLNQTFARGDRSEEKKGYDKILNVYTEHGCNEMEREVQLLPPDWPYSEETRIFLFAPLHFGRDAFGYSIMPYVDGLMKDMRHRNFMESISLALENIWQREELSRINRMLEQLYTQDALTGLYNRFGYGKFAESFFEEQGGRVYLIYFDIDNLKKMNDRYGHNMGDLAIKGVSDAIKTVFERETVKVRMGGDEFLVMGAFCGEDDILQKEQRVQSLLEEYARKEKLPFTLCTSMGHVWCEEAGETLEMLVKRADNNMYEVKRRRKAFSAEEIR